jgi:hypothetical protein
MAVVYVDADTYLQITGNDNHKLGSIMKWYGIQILLIGYDLPPNGGPVEC